MTNGDIIRSMTNEQLALFMTSERLKVSKPVFDATGYGIEPQIVAAKILKWLNDPVEIPEKWMKKQFKPLWQS